MNCNNFNFSYSLGIVTKRIADQSNVLISNFLKAVNGVNTYGDYLSIFTLDY